jgi:hypothetical protein
MMSGRFFRDKAAECEELAALAEDWEYRKAFRELARKWELLAGSWAAQDPAIGQDGF